MPDIFDEVEQDLRAERARALASRYGGAVVVAALVAVLAVGAFEGWRWYQTRQTGHVAAAYFTAMGTADGVSALGQAGAADRAKQIQAADGFAAIAAKGHAGYATLARLREAALKADLGDTAAALALWDSVASDRSVDPMLRDVANLLWVQHQLDTGNPAQLTARLQVLASIDNPFRGLALESTALLDLRTHDTAAARTALQTLVSDTAAPQDARARASALLARLGG